MKKHLTIVIVLLSIGLMALMALQIYWVRSVLKLKEDQFDATVNRVLTDVTKEVEDQLVCFELFTKEHFAHGQGIYLIKQTWDSSAAGENFVTPIAENNRILNLDTITTYFHYKNRTDTLFPWTNLKFSHPASVEVSMKFVYDDDKKASMVDELLIDSGNVRNYTAQQFQQTTYDKRPLREKIDTLLLDSLLHAWLAAGGITIDFSYAMKARGTDSIAYANPGPPSEKLLASELHAGLFENDHFNVPYDLLVYFPGKLSFIISSVTPVLIVALLIIAMLVLVFWFAVRTLLKENKLANMKNEFINNMTHEFKTPVSTMALALETITSPEIINDRGRLLTFLGVMKDESARLESQVERVLQIAALEKNELLLKLCEVNLNDLVKETVKEFDLYARIKHAAFCLNLDEGGAKLQGDEKHLRNMIYNLVDNAMKYSNGHTPEIKIVTRAMPDCIEFSIEDNGIGMSEQEQKRVFDKFYRIPTGYIHNIKGFGLGLSYVKQIVKLHHGKITVKSTPDVGSTFTIRFEEPICN